MLRPVTHRLLLLVCTVLLVFITVEMTRGDRSLTGPESWIKEMVGTIQGWLSAPVGWVASSELHEDRPANEAELLRLKARIRELERENRELKRLIGFREERGIEAIPSRVIYRNPDRWTGRITINRGKKDGIREKMPVVTADGLIGRVQSVTNATADVRLLTDSGDGPGIAAVIQTENQEDVLGIIEGHDPGKGCLIMRKVPVTAEPRRGDIVVTSELSEMFPGGLLIGRVESVSPGSLGAEKTVCVKPAASFEGLRMVMVVRDPDKLLQ
ncbi:rod shape-determining protein MreC [Staphylospora marina]|uniref:rod shape-determining protein MreC n=1 Tax=Staphylospora marina TaxID=2490858 RepID=UPI000F5BBE8E|nr:rod shape-determining protein MreC [Staphylospora marina]